MSQPKKKARRNVQSVLFVCIAFLTMTLVSYLYVRNIVDNQMRTISSEVMNTTETAVRAMLTESEGVFFNITQSVSAMVQGGVDNGGILASLKGTNATYRASDSPLPDFLKTYGYIRGDFLDGSGWIPPEDYVPQSRPWFIGAMHSPGEVFFSEPYLDADTKDICISFSRAIADAEGRYVGVMAIDLDLSRISAYIANKQIKNGGYGILLSDTMHFVQHPHSELRGVSIMSIAGDYPRIGRMLLDGEPVLGQPFVDIDGSNNIIYLRTIFNGWHIGIITPVAQYYAQVYELALVLGILGILLMISLSYILVRTQNQRLRSDQENQSKSEFLSRMSHEMRTPLNAILGMTEIALSAHDMAKVQYCLSQIQDASSHLLGVINDVLDMSKIEAGKLELDSSPFLLADMLQQVTTVIQIKVDEKKQQFTRRVDADVPPLLIGDRQRLAQVLVNLLGNASKFTDEGGKIGLSVARLADHNGKCTLQFIVSDSGIGIDEQQQKKLFNAFEQGDGSVSRKYGGSGLGLPISRNIIRKMDGDISVFSVPGSGTQFTFHVRLGYADEAQAPAEERSVEAAVSRDVTGLFAGKRALLAEDVAINQEILLEMLSDTGLAIDCADDGGQACEMFAAADGAYDIVFMDIHMPEVDGYEATRRIRSMDVPGAKEVPIIAMTANVFAEDIQRCLDAGMNDHLGKPLIYDDIIRKISLYLLPQ